MSIEQLTEIEIFRGIFGLIFASISIILGIKIILRYFLTKEKVFISVGLTWIFISSAWWGGVFSFLSFVLFNYAFEPFLYLLLGTAFIPAALICWIYSFSVLTYPNLKNKIISVFLVICVSYEVILIILLFTNINLVGTLEERLNSRHGIYTLPFLIFTLVTALIAGILFGKKSLESGDPKIRWKGRFISIAFIIFTFGAFLEVIIPSIPVMLVLVKIILILSGVLYYLGFFLPDRLSTWLIKKS